VYTATRTGSARAIAREMREIPRSWVPYATSAALTKSAQAAQRAIVADMPRRFDRPTAYTLGALRVEPSTAATLSARVAVKDQAGGRGTRPESYLLPEVEGGPRREKRTERALRLAGLLRPGEWVVPGSAAPLDANGNLSGAVSRSILRQVLALQRGGRTVAPTRGGGGYFVGAVGKRGTRGVWLREGRETKPILIFTRTPPSYRSRLPFVELAERAARDTFPAEFARQLDAIRDRNR
jgi:hypothetical protein